MAKTPRKKKASTVAGLLPADTPFCRLNDYFFKYRFGKEQAKPELLSLINAILARPGREALTAISLKNVEVTPDEPDNKEARLDILARTPDGRRINIEMQVRNDSFIAKRSLFYWARVYGDQLEKGRDYRELHPVIMINILNFNNFKDTTDRAVPHREFALRERTLPEVLTNDLEIHFLEIPKYVPGCRVGDRHLENWLKYFSPRTTDAELEEIAMTDTAIKNTLAREKRFRRNQDAMLNYTHRQLEIMSYNTNIAVLKENARRERAEGIAEGMELKSLDIARSLLAKGMQLEVISEVTGVSVAEILKMKKK